MGKILCVCYKFNYQFKAINIMVKSGSGTMSVSGSGTMSMVQCQWYNVNKR